MKEKILEIIEEEAIFPPKKYQEAFTIVLTGLCGSGKSLVSKLLSQELSLYVVSGDYVRNLIGRFVGDDLDTLIKNRPLVNEIHLEECIKLVNNNYSIVVDRSVANEKEKAIIDKIPGEKIFIKIISTDEKNIENIKKRSLGNEVKVNYFGHQNYKSCVQTEEDYYLAKARKSYTLSDNIYQYFIKTDVTLEELKKQIVEIAEDIKKNHNVM